MVIQATQDVNVSLDNKQQKAITASYLREVTDWKPTYFIKDDGWVYDNKMCHTTHSFEVEAKVRLANEEDKALYTIFTKHLFDL
jgi:hypothetical protein